MGEPQRSDAVESDRRSSPRLPAELLGKASVRLLGGSEVTLINFSERGILFQSETRLLVGARGTIRIVVGTETTIAAGTVVRSLVQGMASGKLAFHTALALDQPLMLAAAVEARERAAARAKAPEPAVVEAEAAVVDPPVSVVVDPPAPGKWIEKRSQRPSPAQADVADVVEATEWAVEPPVPAPGLAIAPLPVAEDARGAGRRARGLRARRIGGPRAAPRHVRTDFRARPMRRRSRHPSSLRLRPAAASATAASTAAASAGPIRLPTPAPPG